MSPFAFPIIRNKESNMAKVWEKAAQYTDVVYVTQRGLRIALGTSQNDWAWSHIQNYRLSAAAETSLRAISASKFWVCRTERLNQKYADFEESLKKYKGALEALLNFPEQKKKADKDFYFRLLSEARDLEGKNIPDVTLRAMLSGMYRENNPLHTSILGYKKALEDLAANPNQFPGEDYLAKIYGYLLGTDELTSFYRETDSRSVYTTSVYGVNTNYEECRADEIEKMMENFFGFLNYDNLSYSLKALVALYFIHYIKPFDRCNDLIASLLAKAILASGGMGEAAVYLPLEKILKKSPKFDDIDGEIQRSADITYFIIFAMDSLRGDITSGQDAFTRVRRDALDAEARNAPKEEKEPEPEVPVEPTPVSMAPNPAPKPIEVAPESLAEPKKAAPVRSEPVAQAPAYAFVAPKSELSDKEIRDAARYIRQTNPNIRKAQALFFAGHCTMGCYYTIQDYKRATKCAYETARTSMDNLAREGYYQKLQVKNKFVYKPIKQGENDK